MIQKAWGSSTLLSADRLKMIMKQVTHQKVVNANALYNFPANVDAIFLRKTKKIARDNFCALAQGMGHGEMGDFTQLRDG